ncbi:MAG: DUF1906 domain-containing protein [Corynebacterium sp.]|uniref:DUF1906 domain-containing protein n=1 Tax=Corynebacterium sp. TaxID=1720 RepID=UPI0026DC9C8E|nr:DUF1906 domain-containing protein [Corynebacterium sp.]MDO5097338.1 DUF1906 domain-containing protein [Corynebacterium sp.]
MSIFSRRRFLKTTAVALAGALTLSTTVAPTAHALGPVLGTVIDYAAGVPSATAIRDAGHIGTVRYVSQRRPGTETWMVGKPVTIGETQAQARQGLKTASVYQFGKDASADWKQGAAGAAIHAPQAIALHVAAGGPKGRPIYVAIDDNPSRQQYEQQIRPYLQAFNTALRSQGYSMGVYGNYNTIDWSIQDGLGSYFWQHDWGSNGRIHPRTTIHQKAGFTQVIGGVTVDVNNVYAQDWGQWTPGEAGTTPAAPAAPGNSSPSGQGGSLPFDAQTLNQIGNTLNSMSSQIPGGRQFPMPSADQINMALEIAKKSS